MVKLGTHNPCYPSIKKCHGEKWFLVTGYDLFLIIFMSNLSLNNVCEKDRTYISIQTTFFFSTAGKVLGINCSQIIHIVLYSKYRIKTCFVKNGCVKKDTLKEHPQTDWAASQQFQILSKITKFSIREKSFFTIASSARHCILTPPDSHGSWGVPNQPVSQ